MTLIDFTEIAEANAGGGEQDRFELFARDFLQAIGFKILEGPGRGADRGRDLLVTEQVAGTVTAATKVWLVSAKHKAHSGRSVTDSDEPDPTGRVRKFKASGFMGVYSTLPSSGLDDTYARIRNEFDVYVWDSGRLEQQLVSDSRLRTVLQTYFPESYKRLLANPQGAVQLFTKVVSLHCANCGKDLLHEGGIAGYVMQSSAQDEYKYDVVDIYWACRGVCDTVMKGKLPRHQFTTWKGLDDLRIPLVFVQYLMATFNNMRAGRDKFSDVAFDKEKELLLAIAQTVVRDATEEQKEKLRNLYGIPAWLGGLNYEM